MEQKSAVLTLPRSCAAKSATAKVFFLLGIKSRTKKYCQKKFHRSPNSGVSKQKNWKFSRVLARTVTFEWLNRFSCFLCHWIERTICFLKISGLMLLLQKSVELRGKTQIFPWVGQLLSLISHVIFAQIACGFHHITPNYTGFLTIPVWARGEQVVVFPSPANFKDMAKMDDFVNDAIYLSVITIFWFLVAMMGQTYPTCNTNLDQFHTRRTELRRVAKIRGMPRKLANGPIFVKTPPFLSQSLTFSDFWWQWCPRPTLFAKQIWTSFDHQWPSYSRNKIPLAKIRCTTVGAPR